MLGMVVHVSDPSTLEVEAGRLPSYGYMLSPSPIKECLQDKMEETKELITDTMEETKDRLTENDKKPKKRFLLGKKSGISCL
jgi:hypothetical protein